MRASYHLIHLCKSCVVTFVHSRSILLPQTYDTAPCGAAAGEMQVYQTLLLLLHAKRLAKLLPKQNSNIEHST